MKGFHKKEGETRELLAKEKDYFRLGQGLTGERKMAWFLFYRPQIWGLTV